MLVSAVEVFLLCLDRAASSEGKSFVGNVEHVRDSNSRMAFPSRVVECSNALTVDSVCNRNFARACHVASSKRSV